MFMCMYACTDGCTATPPVDKKAWEVMDGVEMQFWPNPYVHVLYGEALCATSTYHITQVTCRGTSGIDQPKLNEYSYTVRCCTVPDLHELVGSIIDVDAEDDDRM